uniref:ABC-type glutathione-S-conjugate transporter n=1 Tax=Panagrellus redivivus TaxID=6233 RepID=A0A7E4W3Z9_PANRE
MLNFCRKTDGKCSEVVDLRKTEFLGSLLFINGTVLWAYSLYEYFTLETGPDSLQIIGYTFLYFALAVALVLTVASRNRGLVTSGVLFIFWFLLAICGLPEFWYKLNTFEFSSLDETEQSYSTFYFINYMIYYGLVLLEFLFNCFADTPKYRVIDKKSCPELYSSFLNQITYTWYDRLATKGYKRGIVQDDLYDLNSRDQSKHLLEKFTKVWDDFIETSDLSNSKTKSQIDNDDSIKPTYINGKQIYLKQPPSIIWPLFKTFKWPFLGGGMYKFIFDIFSFASPQLLHYLINFIEDKSQPEWIGIMIALVMFGVSCIQSLILHSYFHSMFRLGMNIRALLTSLVYRKSLYLSNKARKTRTVGQIVTLMSVDCQRFQDTTSFIMLFWSAPLQIGLAVYFLWQLLGWSVLCGLLVLVLCTPLNWLIAAQMRKCQTQQMKLKDERLKVTNEALNGMKVLKLYAWESNIQKVILEIRKKEIAILKKLALLNAATALSWSCAPFLVAVVTFGVFVIIDPENNVLTPQVTFVALSLFNILRFPLAILAMIWGQAIQSQVSNKRLKEFLAEDEIEHIPAPEGIKSDVAIGVSNGNFTWGEEEDSFQLQDININIKKGSLVAIVGRIGSGKTSLMSALLGEMQCLSGGVAISGSVAYVPQQPWIQNLSLKKNILFNQNYHQLLYERVLEACALTTDLKSLPAGDETEIGEKGINLSGGQKQRVSLARSVYSQTDVYLFDDPLSAVDAHVGKHIFENVISSQTGMLKYHTRILVTHGLNYLKHCDQIIVMKDGKISESGSYEQLISDSGEFSEILEEFLIEEAKNRGRSVSFGEDADEVREVLADLERLHPVKTQQIQRQISQSIDRLSPGPVEVDVTLKNNKKVHTEDPDRVPLLPASNGTATVIKPGANRAKLIEKEGVETGQVKLNVYSTYLRAIGIPVTLLFIIIYTASSIIGVYSNLYLADWSDHAAEIQASEQGSHNSTVRLSIYTALGLGQASLICIASTCMAMGMVVASKSLHEKMLKNILRSPMAFFDVTPLGRILNRFSKDVDGLDGPIPRSLMAFVRTVIASIETIVVIAFATPWFTPCFCVLAVVYYLVLRFYISTSRQLKRLEATTRSPIYSHFQESIQGATSIRAFRSIDHFILESQKRIDTNLEAYYPSIVANRWLAVRLELVGSCIVLFSALLAVLFRDDGVTPGLVGLSVSYAFNITQTLNWAVRMTSELETNIVAVERIKEYSDTPTEGDVETAPAFKLSKSWPSRGSINIEDLEVKYRPELDLVLKGLNAHISSKEKVGVVGRTGAGKSSLMMALFRLVEPHYGKIVIDGVDITTLGLDDLRSRLTIVPQDPVLFSGTLRKNLDPFDRHSDAEIWEALKLTGLENVVSDLPGVLEFSIQESGGNLSVGQRQLICLARALLRKTKLLVLDEAAASVDVETDQMIQRTMQQNFADCTVLTIAHRLQSVKNSDRIMVLDSGNVVEFDSPDALLNDPTSMFHSMAVDAGLISH